MVRLLIRSFVVLLFAAPSHLFAQKILQYNDQVFDFGHVGIEFTVFHNYKYINATSRPIHITGMDIPCDCSNVIASDTAIQPGDTVYFRLALSTRNLYGPTNKAFKIMTDNPEAPEIQFFSLSIVGQWFNGVKPTPLSLFFLPGKKSDTVSIPNPTYSHLEITDTYPYDTTYSFHVLKKAASKGEQIQLEITPSTNLNKGTYQSNLTVELSKDDGNSTILTVPIKIVRY